MARDDRANWMDELPMVLLGVRSAWRAALDASPAELTFGTTLHLPGEMIEATTGECDTHEFLRQLKKQMPTQTSDHGTAKKYNVPSARLTESRLID